jgi:hypothetical protein
VGGRVGGCEGGGGEVVVVVVEEEGGEGMVLGGGRGPAVCVCMRMCVYEGFGHYMALFCSLFAGVLGGWVCLYV